jgi:hypothetical protein
MYIFFTNRTKRFWWVLGICGGIVIIIVIYFLFNLPQPGEKEVSQVMELDSLEIIKKASNLLESNQVAEALQLIEEGLKLYPDNEKLKEAKSQLITTKFIQSMQKSYRDTSIEDFGKFIKQAGLIFTILVLIEFVIILMFLKKSPWVASTIYITSIYIIAVPLAFAVWFSTVLVPIMELMPKEQNPMAQMMELMVVNFRHLVSLAVVAYLGAVGGAINASYIISKRDKKQVPREGVFCFFFFRPIHGLFLAAVMYLAVLSGSIAILPNVGSTTPSLVSVGLLAVLTGIFSESAIEKLRELSRSFFGTSSEMAVKSQNIK